MSTVVAVFCVSSHVCKHNHNKIPQQDKSLVGCDTVSLHYYFSVFRKILLPSFSISPRRRVFLGLLDSEHLGTLIP